MKHSARKPAPRRKFDPVVKEFLDAVAAIITKQLLGQHAARAVRAGQSEGAMRAKSTP